MKYTDIDAEILESEKRRAKAQTEPRSAMEQECTAAFDSSSNFASDNTGCDQNKSQQAECQHSEHAHDKSQPGKEDTAASADQGSVHLIPGCHLAASRTLYLHHGIYAGDGMVISHLRESGITLYTLEEFADGDAVILIDHGEEQKYTYAQALERARSQLGQKGDYKLLTNNCEHFANWCLTGRKESSQVKKVLAAGAALTVIAAGYYLKKGKNPIGVITTAVDAYQLLTSDKVQDAIAEIGESVLNTASKAADSARDYARRAQEKGAQTASDISRASRESAAAAVQTLIEAGTQVKAQFEKLGDKAGKVSDKVSSKVSDTAQQVQELGTELVTLIKDLRQ